VSDPSQSHERFEGNAFFASWARTVLRFRFPLLAATILITVAAVYQARTKLQLQTSLDSFTADNSDARRSLEAFRDTFGRDDVFLVVAEGDVFSLPYLEKLKALHGDAENLDVDLSKAVKVVKMKAIDKATDKATKSDAKAPGPSEPAPPSPSATESSATESSATESSATESSAAGESTGEADDSDPFGDMSDFGDAETDDAGEKAATGAGEAGESGSGGGDAAKAAGKGAGNSGKGAGVVDEWGGQGGSAVIDQVISLINVRKVTFENDTLKVGDLLDPFPTQADLPAVKKFALSEPSVLGQVLGPRAQHSLLVVRTVQMTEEESDVVFKALNKLIKKHEGPGFKLAIAGPPALTAWLKSSMQRDMKVLFGSAIFVMLFVLGAIFRHPLGVVGPILVIVMSVIWTVGMMATTGMPMTLITNIMPAFLMAVGLGDAIHLVSVYRDLRREGAPNNEAIERALASVGVPLLFTTLTTAMGLLSFNFATVTTLSQMGNAAAFGVFVALLHSVVFLPIVLSFNKLSLMGAKEVEGGDRLDRVLWRLTGMATRRAGGMTTGRSIRTAGLAAVLIAIGAYGMSTLAVSHNPLAWLPTNNPLRVVFDDVDREVGGTATVQLLIDTKTERGLKDLGFLKGLEALEAHIKTYRDPRMGDVIGKSVSVLDVVRETNKALHGGDQAHYRIPDTQRAASDVVFMFENSGPDDLRRLATADLKTTQMTVRVKWMDANAYPPLAKHVLAGVDKHLAKHANVRVTGSIYTLGDTVSGLIDNLLRSFGAAFLVITLFMVVLLRDIKLGLIAMVPNLMPIVFIMGLMGLVDVPIDMGNLMLASIAIGIAVDDTIHFLHQFKQARDAGAGTEAAIEHAVLHAGRAMVATSLVLSLGFSVFVTGSMLHLQRFGGLIALTALIALLVDVIFTPALLRLAYRDK